MSRFSSPLPYAADVELIPLDEEEDIQRVVDALKLLLARSFEKSGKFRSDVHVKAHGYVPGAFTILPDLPDELAQGLFRQPRTYPAVARFSNAAPEPQADAIPDGRGMAIKVLGVNGDLIEMDDQKGPVQDFVMVNHPVFFARNVKDFLRLEEALVHGKNQPLATMHEALTGGDWNPMRWHWREMMTIAQIAGKPPAHPASNTYFSATPFRFGDHIVKYRVKPGEDRHTSYVQLIERLVSQPDALGLALEETLRNEDVHFDFQVQLRTSVQSMPIEDATVEWPESESPYRSVARLSLPRQEIQPLLMQDSYRDLAFDVWHTLEDHRPLGGINRVRRHVYPVSADWRRQKAQAEQTSHGRE